MMTTSKKKNPQKRDWYVIDAYGKLLRVERTLSEAKAWTVEYFGATEAEMTKYEPGCYCLSVETQVGTRMEATVARRDSAKYAMDDESELAYPLFGYGEEGRNE